MSSYVGRLLTLVCLLLILPFASRGYQTGGFPSDELSDLLLQDQFEEAQRVLGGFPDSPEVVAFKGEIEFRKGRFEQARAYYASALVLDSATARAHFGLGKLAMGKARHAEAIASLSRAVELEPDVAVYRLALADAWAYEGDVTEQARQLKAYVELEPTYDLDRLAQVEAVLAVIADFGPVPMAEYELREEPTGIQVSQRLNLIFTDVMFGEKGPFEFIVDTGASQSVLTDRLIDELGLRPIASTAIYGVGGDSRVESSIYRLNELTVGPIRIQNLPVGNLSDPILGELADGVFSVATFGEEVVSIDYPASRIEINPADRTPGERVPAWLFSNVVLIPLNVNGEHEGLFLLDTGAATSVLSHSMASELGIGEGDEAGIDLGLIGIAGMSGRGLVVSDVTVSTDTTQASFPLMVAIDFGEVSKALGVELGGIVGYDFLKDYRVTLDFQNAEISLSR